MSDNKLFNTLNLIEVLKEIKQMSLTKEQFIKMVEVHTAVVASGADIAKLGTYVSQDAALTASGADIAKLSQYVSQDAALTASGVTIENILGIVANNTAILNSGADVAKLGTYVSQDAALTASGVDIAKLDEYVVQYAMLEKEDIPGIIANNTAILNSGADVAKLGMYVAQDAAMAAHGVTLDNMLNMTSPVGLSVKKLYDGLNSLETPPEGLDELVSQILELTA